MNQNSLTAILALLITISFLCPSEVCGKHFLAGLSETPAYVTIYKSDSGFYALANVSLNNDNSEKDPVKMLICTYSSISLLGGQCLNFNPFDCQKHKCDDSNDTIDYSFPYFTAEGPSIKAYVELGDWNSRTQAVLSTRCLDGEMFSYGNETYGILSLGVSGYAWANFDSKSPEYSLYFFPNGTVGELAFSKDLRRIEAGTQPIVLHVDNNWRIQTVKGVKVGNYRINNLAKLIFDPNEDTIAFSLKTYKRILIGLNKGQIPIKCNNRGQKDFYRPNCTYHGELKDLPNITIVARYEVLIIRPEQYVKDPETFNSTIGHLTLNIKAIYDVVHTPENHVTADYKAYIIVGHPFLKDYYVFFNGNNYAGNNNTIEFYTPNHYAEEVSKVPWLIIGIVLAVVISGSFITAGIYFIKKRKNRQTTLQDPLVHNVEEQPNIPNNNEQSRAPRSDQLNFGDIPPIPNQPQSEPFASENPFRQ